MNPEKHNTIAFFGKMTANLTHEVKNILAIIQESAGLMEDIMAISPLSQGKYQEKFDNSMATIKGQLQRGMDLTTQFNRFAHLPDRSCAELDLAQSVRQFCTLSERFARLRHIGLEAGSGPPAGGPGSLKTNPILLFMAMFHGLESCLSALPEKTRIRVTASAHGGRPAIEFTCDGENLPAAGEFFQKLQATSAWGELGDAMEQLQAKIECFGDTPGFRLVFYG